MHYYAKINDIVVLAPGFGEAPDKDSQYQEMKHEERQAMTNRLFDRINKLMEIAQSAHLKNSKPPESKEVDMDVITRLSTNEFFFYTQSPLNLEEFQALQNKIADNAQMMEPGVQLVLGTFAVRINGYVANVAAHITCGSPPSFNFVVKNKSSEIDVRYKEKTEQGDFCTLPFFDKKSFRGPLMPSIAIHSKPVAFQFEPIIRSETPSKKPFLTAVEICVDHCSGIAFQQLNKMTQENNNVQDMPFSHVILSNTITPDAGKCIGMPLHADPRYGMEYYSVTATEGENAPYFGTFKAKLFYLKTETPNTVQKLSSQTFQEIKRLLKPMHRNRLPDQNRFNLAKYLFSKELNEQIVALQQLKWGLEDKEMNTYIEHYAEHILLKNIKSDWQDIAFEVHLAEQFISNLRKDPTLAKIKMIVADLRRNPDELFAKGNLQKAVEIEQVIGEIPIKDRLTNKFYNPRDGRLIYMDSTETTVYNKVKHLLPSNPYLPPPKQAGEARDDTFKQALGNPKR